MKKYLGSNLRYLREKNGLTGAKLAEMLGVHESTINYYEKGKRYPSPRTAQSVADLFQISVYALCNTDLEITVETELLHNSTSLMGYVIEYSEKDAFEPAGEPKKVLCTQNRLVWILERNITYTVWSAYRCDLSHYVQNNPDIPYFRKAGMLSDDEK